MKKLVGKMIPETATKAVYGKNYGVYFFDKGEWHFTAFHGVSIPCAITVPGEEFKIEEYIGNNEIEELK